MSSLILHFPIVWGVGLRERNSHAYRNDAVGQHPFEYWSCRFTAPWCNGLLHDRATPYWSRGHPCQVSMSLLWKLLFVVDSWQLTQSRMWVFKFFFDHPPESFRIWGLNWKFIKFVALQWLLAWCFSKQNKSPKLIFWKCFHITCKSTIWWNKPDLEQRCRFRVWKNALSTWCQPSDPLLVENDAQHRSC